MQNKPSPLDPKKALRKAMRRKRQSLSQRQQQNTSQALMDLLTGFAAYRKAQRLAFYLPDDGEADPRVLMAHAMQNGKACFLPVLDPLRNKRLHFVRYLPTTSLVKNRYGIQEPRLSSRHIAHPATLDIVFMPLVAFNRTGVRLGMGGGYYDRTLAQTIRHPKPALIGLAHSCQEIESLESSPWDVAMDLIATEKELIVPQDNHQPGH